MDIDCTELLDHRELVVLDIRSPDERSTVGYIPGSISCPSDQLPREAFNIRGMIGPHTPVVLACMSGRRSLAMVRPAMKAGFTAVFNLSGGVLAWGAAGLPLCGVAAVTVPAVDSVEQAERELMSCFVAESVENLLSRPDAALSGNPREAVRAVLHRNRQTAVSAPDALDATITQLSLMAWQDGHPLDKIAVNVDRMHAMVQQLRG